MAGKCVTDISLQVLDPKMVWVLVSVRVRLDFKILCSRCLIFSMAAAAAATSSKQWPPPTPSPPSPQPPPTPSPQPPLYSFGVPWPEFNEGLSYTDVVRSRSSALTLIDFYSSKYKHSAPLEGWLHRIKNGQITVDGEMITDPSMVLRDGSKVVYYRLPWKEPSAPYLLEVLYEDDDMVALNKPSGLQVLPGGLFQQRTVLMQLQWKEWRKNTLGYSKQDSTQEAHPVPVHRLGRGTSGILLCAKTKLAKSCLAAYFAKGTENIGENRCEGKPGMRRISKFYRSLVTGVIVNNEVLIKQPIGVMHYPGVANGLYVASSSGKPAMSKVYVLERDLQRNQTLVQVEIHSGRPHQIRIHLASIGHPLLGDPLYGIGGCPKPFEPDPIDDGFAEDGGYQKPVHSVPGDCGYFLHAHQLVLHHPTIHEETQTWVKLVACKSLKEHPRKCRIDDQRF
ncbi:RNA pseudouridine synthase 5 isoform X2 [Phoenix dactylifera]|uniref:RNA pseudouridine synthase 5 isoform X2 n=1 Tax=Phoenix dactylifera TaxID=42345 RepID=A0A8B8J4N3_PHODC|nr:RNA pseudouridine synthase 5 isoform X2 [Phoenix dactylifera]